VMNEVLQAAAGVGMVAWYASALYVGARLLRLGFRRGNPPARWIGTYLFYAMGLGSVFLSIPMARGALEGLSMTPLDRVLVGLGCTFTVVGNVGILTFTRRVFRRESAVAKGAAIAVTGVLVIGLVGHGVTTGFDWRLTTGFAVVYLSGTILANGWAALESLRYYALMRRRLKVGLVSPLEANRFLLWGFGAGAAATILLSSTIELQVHTVLTPAGTEALRMVTLPVMSGLGLACAGCYLFAFLPAAWYVQRLATSPGTPGAR
jgi:hypothetical protein